MKNLFKRLTTAFLAMIMVVTMLPTFAITASAAGAKDGQATGMNYLFAYFTGDGEGQKIRFALSEDGINYSALNGNLPILDSSQLDPTKGTDPSTKPGIYYWNGWKDSIAHSTGARDPYVIKKESGNGYYIVATDLRVGTDNKYNNSKLLVWDVPDITNVDSVKPWAIETAGWFRGYNGFNNEPSYNTNRDYIAWAPEVVYDHDRSMYMMFWSGYLYNSSALYSAWTNDFQHFYNKNGQEIDGSNVRPEVFFKDNANSNTIDGDILYDGSNYYLAYKRESEKQVYFVKSATLDGFAGKAGTKFVDSSITGQSGNGQGYEGPELYQRADGKYVLIVDNYTVNPRCIFKMFAVDSMDEFLSGADFHTNGKEVATNINNCLPRHGGVTQITPDVYNDLVDAYGGFNEAKNAELVAQYFTTADGTYDATGHGYNLTNTKATVSTSAIGGVTNAIHFNNSGMASNNANVQYSSISTAQMYQDYHFTAKQGMTITFNAYDEGNKGGYAEYANIFNIRETAAAPGTLQEADNKARLVYVSSQICSGISNGTDIVREDVKNAATGSWHSYKIIIGINGMQVYRDRNLMQTLTISGVNDQWFAEMFDNGALKIGTSLFGADSAFNGYISDFRIYNTSNQENVNYIDNPPLNIEDGEEMKAFETLMASGKIYTNMKPAYEAYVACQKAHDAKYYGGMDDLDLEPYHSALREAINNMQEFKMTTPEYAYGYVGFAGDKDSDWASGTSYSTYENNVLWGDTDTTNQSSDTKLKDSGGTGSNSNTHVWLKYPNATLLYDGINELRVPMLIQIRVDSKKNRYVYCAADAEPQLRLANQDVWYGSDQADNWAWLWSQQKDNDIGQIKATATSGKAAKVAAQLGNGNYYDKYYRFANMAVFNSSFDTTEYIKEIYPAYQVYVGSNTTYTTTDIAGKVTGNVPIRILNYKALQDAVDRMGASLVDVTKYKHGGLSAYFDEIQTRIDAFKSFNIGTYFNGNLNNYQDAANEISRICGTADNLKTIANNNISNGTYKQDDARYQQLRDAMDTDLSGLASNYELDSARTEGKNQSVKYTSDSYSAFKTAYAEAQAIMRDPLTNGYDNGDKAASAAAKAPVVESTYKNLMPKTTVDVLESTVITNEPIVDEGIFSDNGTQKYTYDSWLALQGSVDTGNTVLTNNTTDGVEIPKYETKTEAGKTVTDFANETAAQKEITTSINNIISSNQALKEIDDQDAYDAFDSAIAVIDSADKNKYTPEGLALLESIEANAVEQVNLELTDEQIAACNKSGLTVGNTVRKTGKQETDAITTEVLTANSELNDTANGYVKKFKAVYTDSNNTKSTQEAYYGEEFTFNEPTLADNQYVKWSVTNYAYGVDVDAANISAEPEGSSKVNSNNSSFKRIADANMVVYADILGGSEDGVVVKIYNAYGKLVDVQYVASENDVSTTDIAKDVIPFYEFSNWNVYKDTDGTVIIRPVYVAKEKYTVSVNGASTTSDYNTKVTATSDDANFYAWASKSNGKYSVASYNSTYNFYVYGNEEFTPITKVADKYYVDGAEVNAADFNVDAKNGKTAQEYLVAKLDQKAPFVAIIRTGLNSADSKYYAYCRVTEKADGQNYQGVSVTMTKKAGGASMTGNITNILSNGQFYVGTKSDVTFKANVTYDYIYNFNGTNTSQNANTSISTVDSSIEM